MNISTLAWSRVFTVIAVVLLLLVPFVFAGYLAYVLLTWEDEQLITVDRCVEEIENASGRTVKIVE